MLSFAIISLILTLNSVNSSSAKNVTYYKHESFQICNKRGNIN